MVLTLMLALAGGFLAYANGANDNFKGVASLFGSRTISYRTAIAWATVTTFAGSMASLTFARALVTRFSAGGLVADEVAGSAALLLAIALGTGLTIIIATYAGFPVSTTHGLTGAMIGSGTVATGGMVNLEPLAGGFLLPLLLSPALAVLLSGALAVGVRQLRVRRSPAAEWCVCVGETPQIVPISQPVAAWHVATPGVLEITAGPRHACAQRYTGGFLGVRLQTLVDAAHVISAGVVGFARGLNDTPKIAAVLLAAQALDIRWSTLWVAVAMGAGGLLSARRVAETMSHRITSMSHVEGCIANISTGVLVILASRYALPVSTTHVSVGSLVGIGVPGRTINTAVIRSIAVSWVLTLPCAALLGGLVYAALRFYS